MEYKEVQRLLRCNRVTIWRYVKSGKIRIEKIINDYHIHRMEWGMVSGNPVEKHYDRFCNKYHGKKFVLTDTFKDRHGNYRDNVIYEIIFNGGEKND